MRLLRWTLQILAGVGVLYLYFATLHPRERVEAHTFFDQPGPWVIAHRGGRGVWPENTLLAFENASALGTDVLEMDLRATADGEIVVMHDATVDRTTDGSGRLSQKTLEQVRALDAGYRFKSAKGEFVFRGRGVRVPTFEEVLGRFGAARLNVEMKGFTQSLAVKLCALLKQGGATNRVLAASFDQASMSAFREACPAVATSATWREGLAFFQLNRMHLASIYRGPAVALQVPERYGNWMVLEPRFLATAAALNVKVQVWTVNEEADMRRLLALGVQGILTDYPDRLLRVLGRAPAGEMSE